MLQVKNKALVIVDVQNDFCPCGALAVPWGNEVVPVINYLLTLFRIRIFTQDWHPENHCSFLDHGGSWPKHCVQKTWGAELRRDLMLPNSPLTVAKGTDYNKEAYSAFEGTCLEEFLKEHAIDQVYVCGLATDYCVKATALDAKKAGFETFVVIDACRGVNVKRGDAKRAIEEMREAGIKIVRSKDV